MNYYWAMLDIAPTSDLKVIKRAYATQLKAHRPEDNAEHFQRLREAYDWACRIGVHWADVEDEDEYENNEDAEKFVEASESSASARAESADAEHILAQAYPALDLILPSIPTHFPMTFEPPPSPSFPPLPPNPPAFMDAPELHPFVASPVVEAAPPAPVVHIAYALGTELTGRRMRTLGQFLADFWTGAQLFKTIPEIQTWLQTQAEYESLQFRPNLETALAEAFTEQRWPWPAVLSVAELLDWGTIGNLVSTELAQAVQLAHLQQRAAITRKPCWHQIFSKSAAAYFLLAPFSWPKTLFSGLLPRTQQIDVLCDEVARVGIDPGLVFNPQQIEFQRTLRQLDFNFPRLAYALTRLIGWPLLFSLLFIAFGWAAPLAGLAFGLTCFALWVGYVANRLLFRMIWTPSPTGDGSKAFWRAFGVTLAIACISVALASPTFAMLLAGFMLFAVAQDFATTLGSGAFGAIVAFIVAAVLWPTQAPGKFVLILPIALSLAVLTVYFYQRRIPTEKLLESLTKPPVRLQPLADSGVGNFNWWWIIAGIALMRLFAAGH